MIEDTGDSAPAIRAAANAVADAANADVILFSGGISWGCGEKFIDAVAQGSSRPNVLLLLVTTGGSADAAYRMARCLQETYERVTLFVSGLCKSAGTLVATGAHELVFGAHGELGPLDVQLRKADELWEMSSGLTVVEAMANLEQRAFTAFVSAFEGLKESSAGQITTKTAMEAAASLTTGLFRPVFEQIDPMHVGEAWRATMIAQDYGNRLARVGRNISEQGLVNLTAGFASHEFVIDQAEAATIFRAVRSPTPEEADLADVLGGRSRLPFHQYDHAVEFLSDRSESARSQGGDGEHDREHGPSPEAGDQAATGPGESARRGPGPSPEGPGDPARAAAGDAPGGGANGSAAGALTR
jgi:hypothetical protein